MGLFDAMDRRSQFPDHYLEERPALRKPWRMGIWLCMPALIAIAFGFLASSGVLDWLEFKSIDIRFQRRGVLVTDPRIVVVEIDEVSRRELTSNQRRFDLRAQLDDAIIALADAGAVVIGIDAWLYGRGDDTTDSELADAIREANVVLARTYSAGLNIKPADIFIEAEALQGVVNVRPDADGVLRRIPTHPNLGMADIPGAEQIPHFAFVLAWMLLAEEEYAAGREPEPADFSQADRVALMGRTVEYGRLLNFAAGPGEGFHTTTLADLIKGRFDSAPIDGAAVLIGEARSIQDQLRMPLSDRLWPGVYYHANVLDQILQDRPLRDWPHRLNAVALLAAVVSAIAGWYFWFLQPWWERRAGWLGMVAYFALGAAVFVGGWWYACERAFQSGIVLPMAAPMLGIAAAMLSGLAVQALITIISARRIAQRSRQIESLFGRSVSHQVLEAIKQDPQHIARTELHEVTVLFCDIRGFTSVSTKLSPDQVAQMLNEYFDAITQAVFANDGFIDKFVGDELMAVFGVPLPQPDHVLRATRSALAIKQELADLNKRRIGRGETPLDCGVGVHCGEVAAGHIGTAERANYTVVGDTVNMAARIEGLTKDGEILISQEVYEKLEGAIPARSWQTVTLRGSDREHRLYEVVQSANIGNRA